MVYTPLTYKAMHIAYNAHHEQLDKSGAPYIFHPIHLAEQMTDEASVCVALLHDVAEDTPITLAQLVAAGFPPEVMEALRLMTHDDSVPYMDYVAALKGNHIAKAVKAADLRHNSDLTRLDHVDDAARARAEKYARALALLTGEDEDHA